MELPDETVVYAGHDYVRDSLAFARRLEPENRAIGAFLRRYDPKHVFSTLAEEKKINPYLRFNEPGIVNLLAKLRPPPGNGMGALAVADEHRIEGPPSGRRSNKGEKS